MGPFELMDFIGNDELRCHRERVRGLYHDSRYRPALTQRRLVEQDCSARKWSWLLRLSRWRREAWPTRDANGQSIVDRTLAMLVNRGRCNSAHARRVAGGHRDVDDQGRTIPRSTRLGDRDRPNVIGDSRRCAGMARRYRASRCCDNVRATDGRCSNDRRRREGGRWHARARCVQPWLGVELVHLAEGDAAFSECACERNGERLRVAWWHRLSSPTARWRSPATAPRTSPSPSTTSSYPAAIRVDDELVATAERKVARGSWRIIV